MPEMDLESEEAIAKSEVGAIAVLRLIRKMPGFKIVILMYAETPLQFEVEASGAVGPSPIRDPQAIAMLKRGLLKGASLLIRQGIPGTTEIIVSEHGTPKPASWWALYGAQLGPDGAFAAIEAELLEECHPASDFDGRLLYKDLSECIPRR